MEDKTPVLLVTANVGSIFEEPDSMIELWIQEFLQTVARLNAKFVALHCQEVGGKNYETRMQHVDNFVKMLTTCEELREYDKAEIFLDEDFSCAENFTALGNFYFIHRKITDVFIWDFEDLKFQNVNGKNVHSGNIEDVPVKEKSKFPQNFFPECKWSRKGYLRTRWSLNGSVFDLVNIHLFHDASNFIAMQAFPSVYTVTRQKALQYTLDRFCNHEEQSAPFFLFGDFNFRTDTRGVVKKLARGLNECKDSDSSIEDEKVQYKDNASEVVITIGKKEFCHSDHQNVFINDSGEWLKEYDREMDAFKDQLFEFPIKFLPSYPFEENNSSGKSYMKTRCPAWCDRVLLSVTAKQLISHIDDGKVEYGIIGKESCMGDHKPVFLFFSLKNGAGMIQSKLTRRKCDACKISTSAFCDTVESPLAFKSHISCSPRCDVTSVVLPCNNSKKHHRNASRCFETNISSMSTVTELSDRVNDHDICIETPPVTGAISTLGNLRVENNGCDENNLKTREHIRSYSSVPPLTDDSVRSITSDNVSLHDFCKTYETTEFVNRTFEDNVAVRSNSATIVVESTWRSKTCTCLQDSSWRMRSISSCSRASSWNSDTRVRLKSDPNLKSSLPRIQSHHSSSDEEWFEEVEEFCEEEREDKQRYGAIEDIEEYIEFDANPETERLEETTSSPFTTSNEDRQTKRYFLFCIPRKWSRKRNNEKNFSQYKLKKEKYFRFLSPKRRRCRFCCVL